MENSIYESENTIEEIITTLDSIDESNKKLQKYTSIIKIEEILNLIENYKLYNKKYRKKILSIILTIFTTLSILSGAKRIFKNYIIKETRYTKDIMIDRYYKSNNPVNTAYIIESDYTNKIRVYDVSEYTFEDIKEFMDLNLDNIDFIYLDNITNTNINKTVIKSKVDTISYSLYKVFILFLLYTLLIKYFNNKTIIKNMKDKKYENKIFNYFYNNDLLIHLNFLCLSIERELLDETINDINKYFELRVSIKDILNEIEKNEELRNKFVELFNKNKYLLNEPDILLEKYNETLKELDLIKTKKELTTINKSLKRVLK